MLQYSNRRYYDAVIERFISTDPIGYSADDLNLYRYVWGNPIRYTDPNGTQAGAGNITNAQFDYAFKQCAVTCGFDNPWTGFKIVCGYVINFFQRPQSVQDLINKMYQIQQAANDFATKAIAELGVKNSEMNHAALRHCYMSAKTAQLLGGACAGCLGSAREDYEDKYQRQQPDVSARGRKENATGLLCAISPNVESCCKNMLDKMTS